MAKATLNYQPEVFQAFAIGKKPGWVHKRFPIARATAYRWYEQWVNQRQQSSQGVA